RPSTRLLDVACGSGGPALHLVGLTGCDVVGVELDEDAMAAGNKAAHAAGLEMRARFVQADAGRAPPLRDDSFDAILCIDSINHLPDRASVLADWARLLGPKGRLLFTDPVVVTGLLGSDEIAVRSSIGYFLFVPPGENERLLGEAGLTVLAVEDTTEQLAEVAQRRHDARATHAEAVRQVRETRRSRVASVSSTSSQRSPASAVSPGLSTSQKSRGSSTAKGAGFERATQSRYRAASATVPRACDEAFGVAQRHVNANGTCPPRHV